MPQSLARLCVHLVFSTKNREPIIAERVRTDLHAYMATVLTNLGCPTLIVNSMADHVHLLFDLGRTVAVSVAVEDVKKSSSKWIKTQGVEYSAFAWQAGYVRSRSASQMWIRFGTTSQIKRSTTVKAVSRKNFGRF